MSEPTIHPIERIRDAFERAHAICVGSRAHYMSIPPNPERDADLILTDAIDELESLRARVAELEREVETLSVASEKNGRGYLKVLEKFKSARSERDAALARVAELELENSRLRTPLRPIVDRIHKALGCAEQSDDGSLPEMVETWVREHRAKIAELEREVERVSSTARDLVVAYGVHRGKRGAAWWSMHPNDGVGDVWAKLLAALAPRAEVKP